MHTDSTPSMEALFSDTRRQENDAGEQEADIEYIQVIGLLLAGEQFAVDILNVREIVRFAELEITRVPHAHPYVMGVVNLRGKVVPVVDLALRLGLPVETRGERARMVVVEMEEQMVGFTVDGISEVLRLPEQSIDPASSDEEYIAGVATVDGQIATLIELEKLLSEGKPRSAPPNERATV